MVEVGRHPCRGRVAVVAVVATGDVRRVFAGCGDAVVAAAARADDLRVIDGERRQPPGRGVAVFAEVRRLNVFRVLARCVETVVAARTATVDPSVVEHDGDPRRAGMAVIALFTRLRMAGRLAGGDDTVVTIATAAFCRGVIHVGDRAPCRRRVAVRAQVCGRYMVNGLRRCLDRANCRVAVHAGRVRTLEGTARVAAFAGHVGVSAVKRKPGAEMIEWFLRV